MKSKPQKLEYQLHFVGNEAESLRSNELFRQKLAQLSIYASSKAEANTLAGQSTMVITRQAALSNEEKPIYPFGILIEYSLDNCSVLMNVANFVNAFCEDDDAGLLSIRISNQDVDGFRAASFIVSYCNEKKKKVLLQNYDDGEILPLYEPHISNSTLHLLFSLVDFWLGNGKFPLFGELKDHHFRNLEQIESDRKHWDNSRDSQFVSTIYASLRVMQRLLLVQKEFHETKRQMTCIRPTVNGLLTVLFSNYFAQFKAAPVSDGEDEVWDE
jgi:hypothetical protein